MEIFWRLVLGHLISDFTLQTNYIAAWKRRSFWGLLVHCAIHPILYAVLTWKYLNQVWIQLGPIELTGTACLVIIFVTHFIEDEWRIWSVLKRGSPDNTFFYFWDQIIHYAVLFAMSPVVEGATTKLQFLRYPSIVGVLPLDQAASLGWIERFSTLVRPEPWVWIAILFAVVTHFTTVTIYFLEKDMFGAEFPEVHEKYISMAERVVVMTCFLLPGLWWLAVLAFWLGRAVLYKFQKLYDISWISVIIGNLTAVACGLLARYFLYHF
jgi:hypothetical protein